MQVKGSSRARSSNDLDANIKKKTKAKKKIGQGEEVHYDDLLSAAEIQNTWIHNATLQMIQLQDSHMSSIQGSSMPHASSPANRLHKNKTRARSPSREKKSSDSHAQNRYADSGQAIMLATCRSHREENTGSMYDDVEEFWRERRMRLDAVTQAQQAAHESILSRVRTSSMSLHADTEDSEGQFLFNSNVTSMSAASTRERSRDPKQAVKASAHVHTHSCAHDGDSLTKCCKCCVPEYCMCMRGVKPLALTERRRPAPKDVMSSRAYKVSNSSTPTYILVTSWETLFFTSLWHQFEFGVFPFFFRARGLFPGSRSRDHSPDALILAWMDHW